MLTDPRDTAPIPRSGEAAVSGLELFAWAVQSRREISAPHQQNPCTLSVDPPPEAMLIREVLVHHIGRDHAITATSIAIAACLWPDRRSQDRGTRARQIVRTWYEHFALPGYVLIALDAGFFYTADPADVAQYENTTLSRLHLTALTLRRTKLQALTSAHMTRASRGHWSR